MCVPKILYSHLQTSTALLTGPSGVAGCVLLYLVTHWCYKVLCRGMLQIHLCTVPLTSSRYLVGDTYWGQDNMFKPLLKICMHDLYLMKSHQFRYHQSQGALPAYVLLNIWGLIVQGMLILFASSLMF